MVRLACLHNMTALESLKEKKTLNFFNTNCSGFAHLLRDDTGISDPQLQIFQKNCV